MKPKTVILMVVAIGCGLVASVMTSRLIAERDSGEPQEKKIKVLVTKTKVRAFDVIKEPEKFFIEREVSESSVPKKVLRSFDEVKDKRPLRPLGEDSFVNPDDLVNKDLNGLAAHLLPGTRAVAIKVTPESLVGGFVLPSSRVDVLYTLRKAENTATYNILQNMLVLAVDMNSVPDQEKQGMLGNTITLSARPEEAQALATAALTGELRLSLRPLGEDKPVATRGFTVDDLTRPKDNGTEPSSDPEKKEDPYSLASLIPVLPPLPAPPEVKEEPKEEPKEVPKVVEVKPEPIIKKHTLTLIQGDQVQKVTFIKSPTGEVVEEPTTTAPAPAPAPTTAPAPTRPATPAPAVKKPTPPAARPATPSETREPSVSRGSRD